MLIHLFGLKLSSLCEEEKEEFKEKSAPGKEDYSHMDRVRYAERSLWPGTVGG